MEIEGFVGGS
jgi:hypothetical protein